MHKRMIVDYDEVSGTLTDSDGLIIGTHYNLKGFEPEKVELSVKEIIQLKDAGFTAKDIVEMKEGGVL